MMSLNAPLILLIMTRHPKYSYGQVRKALQELDEAKFTARFNTGVQEGKCGSEDTVLKLRRSILTISTK